MNRRSTKRVSRAASGIGFALSLALGASTLLVSACGGKSARELERENTDATAGASPTNSGTGGAAETGGAGTSLGGVAGAFAGSGGNVTGATGGASPGAGSGNVATGGMSGGAGASGGVGGSGVGGSAIGGSGGSAFQDAGLPDASEPVICGGGKMCATTERCNAWTRVCQPLDVPYPPPGQDNGGSCTTEADCRSAGSGLPSRPLCVTQNGADFCVSYCELPPDVDVATTFVRSDCPVGSVCLPSSLQSMPNETTGTCVPECQSDSTCRTEDGYYCRTTYIYPARTFTNGYCAPSHCKSRGCAGFVCGC